MSSNNYPNIGKLTFGKAHNFFAKVSVSWSTFGGGATDGNQPDLIINLPEPTSSVIFNNVSIVGASPGATPSVQVIEYSFDGNTVHGELGSNSQNIRQVFQDRVISTIWFRVQSGSTGPLTVSVEAWGIR